MAIKVALSPFYNGEALHDEASGLTFTHGDHGQLSIFDISRVKNFDGIRRAIRLNALILMEGKLPEQKVEAPAKEEAPQEEVKEEKVEEVVEEDASEDEVSEDKHAHKRKSSRSKK